MTNIEIQTMNAIQSINRKMCDQYEINWEHRRYETAKDILCAIIGTHKEFKEGVTEDDMIKMAVKMADNLLTTLDVSYKKIINYE